MSNRRNPISEIAKLCPECGYVEYGHRIGNKLDIADDWESRAARCIKVQSGFLDGCKYWERAKIIERPEG